MKRVRVAAVLPETWALAEAPLANVEVEGVNDLRVPSAKLFSVSGRTMEHPIPAIVEWLDHLHCHRIKCQVRLLPGGEWSQCPHTKEARAALGDALDDEDDDADGQEAKAGDVEPHISVNECRVVGPRKKPFLSPPDRALALLRAWSGGCAFRCHRLPVATSFRALCSSLRLP